MRKWDIIKEVLLIWRDNPDLSLVQLISNCIPTERDPYYTTDKELVDYLNEYYC